MAKKYTKNRVNRELMEKIGIQIKKLRLARQMTAIKLASICSCSRTCIYQMEQGRYMSLEMLSKISKALNVPLALLFEDFEIEIKRKIV